MYIILSIILGAIVGLILGILYSRAQMEHQKKLIDKRIEEEGYYSIDELLR